MLISVSGREAYQSANWYVSDNQVPTWHYEAVEIEGEARPLDQNGLVDLLDRLSERFETLHSPERPWTRGKMDDGKFEAMTKAIIGFEVDPTRGPRHPQVQPAQGRPTISPRPSRVRRAQAAPTSSPPSRK